MGEKKGVRVWAYLNIYPWMMEDRIGFWPFPTAYAEYPPPNTHTHAHAPIYTHDPSGLQNVAGPIHNIPAVRLIGCYIQNEEI